MIEQLHQLQGRGLATLAEVQDSTQLEAWRIEYISRQGRLPTLLEKMKDVPKEKRPEVGRLANQVKIALLNGFEERKNTLQSSSLISEVADPTMPGRSFRVGAVHVLTQTRERIVQIFRHMGFTLAEGPEIETEYHCFDALNTPADHPGRDELDTLYIQATPHPTWGRYLLRTQTSTVQVRYMEEHKPPIQILSPGRCYRRDEVDATHGMFFHQFEGLVIDEGISLADMVGTLEFFFKELLGSSTRVRFRPHFFPFTEPSFEVDFSIPGVKIRGKEWLEMGGCGMVDPTVLEMASIDSEKYTGFAFGMGIERFAMILHEIPDLRLFYENDTRFLKQFA